MNVFSVFKTKYRLLSIHLICATFTSLSEAAPSHQAYCIENSGPQPIAILLAGPHVYGEDLRRPNVFTLSPSRLLPITSGYSVDLCGKELGDSLVVEDRNNPTSITLKTYGRSVVSRATIRGDGVESGYLTSSKPIVYPQLSGFLRVNSGRSEVRVDINLKCWTRNLPRIEFCNRR